MRVRKVAAAAAVVFGVLTVPAQSVAFAADPVPAAAAAALPSYIPLSPARLLDTRPGGPTIDGVGSGGGAVLPHQNRVLTVGGRGGVAPDAVAVALNVTATQGDANTVLTVYPTGQPMPVASNLNPKRGEDVANMVVAKLGAGGQVDIFNELGSIHVVVDVVGYFPSGSTFTATAPKRFLDTRAAGVGQTIDGQFVGTGVIGHHQVLNLQVGGRSAIPANASAVIVNLTGTQSNLGTFVTAYPTGQPLPSASNLNLTVNEDRPNLAVVRLGAGGQLSLYNGNGNVHLVADVVGWFPADDASFTSLTPARLLDTRTGFGQTIDGQFSGIGRVVAGAPLALTVTGRGGVPAAGVGAVVLNVTGTQADSWTLLSAYPSGESPPAASSLNYGPGQDLPNLVIAKVGADGRVMMANDVGSTHLVVDVLGWFPAGVSPVLSWGCPEGDLLVCSTGPTRPVPANILGFAPGNPPVAVATGPTHSLAVLTNGAVVAWGDNAAGQLGSGSRLPSPSPIAVKGLAAGSGVTQVAAGDRISVARKTNGSVVTWGLAALAPVPVTFAGNTSTVAQVFAAGNQAGAVMADGSLWAWQDNQTAATEIANAGVRSMAGGANHVLILMADSRVWGFGQNDRGQLGDMTNKARLNTAADGFAQVVNADLTTFQNVVAIAAGGNSSYAVKVDGSVWAWGDNTAGQLGNGATSPDPVRAPVAVSGLGAGAVAVPVVDGRPPLAAGAVHAVALKADGSVVAWGSNAKGQLGTGTPASSTVPVAVSGLGAGSGVKVVVASGYHTTVMS
jgi:hypothetical protein